MSASAPFFGHASISKPGSFHQTGVSLISLMVGMVISLIAVLGALALYRSTTQSLYGDGGLVRNSIQDGQLATGLLSAQIALQGAGYGIAGPSSGSHLLLISSAVLNTSTGRLDGSVVNLSGAAQSGNAIVWVQNPNLSANSSAYTCTALLSDSGIKAFYLLQSSTNCHPLASNWKTISWTSRALVEGQVMSKAIALSARNASNCWPYGAVPEAISKLTAPAASVSVTLNYSSSVSGSSNTYTSCLANLIS